MGFECEPHALAYVWTIRLNYHLSSIHQCFHWIVNIKVFIHQFTETCFHQYRSLTLSSQYFSIHFPCEQLFLILHLKLNNLLLTFKNKPVKPKTMKEDVLWSYNFINDINQRRYQFCVNIYQLRVESIYIVVLSYEKLKFYEGNVNQGPIDQLSCIHDYMGHFDLWLWVITLYYIFFLVGKCMTRL